MPGSTSPSLPGTACWPRATLRCAAGRRNLLTSGLERRDRGPPTTPPRARGRLAMVGSAAANRMARPASQTPLLLSLLRCAARKMSACGWPGRRRMRLPRSNSRGHRACRARTMLQTWAPRPTRRLGVTMERRWSNDGASLPHQTRQLNKPSCRSNLHRTTRVSWSLPATSPVSSRRPRSTPPTCVAKRGAL